MEAKSNRQDFDPASVSVFQITGEPAIGINGVPDLPPNIGSSVQFSITSEPEQAEESCFGEWVEGRTVRKLFGDEYYTGKVAKFDREMKWYRVEYEDGDFEDLEWCELKEVLQPLDISVPFNKLIPKISKNGKPLLESGGCITRPRKSNSSSVKKPAGQRSSGSKGKQNIKGNFRPAKVSENLEERGGQIDPNAESRKRGRPKKVDKVSTKMENNEQTAKLICLTQVNQSEESNLLKPFKYCDDDTDGASLETAALVIESIISSITQTENQEKDETPGS